MPGYEPVRKMENRRKSQNSSWSKSFLTFFFLTFCTKYKKIKSHCEKNFLIINSHLRLLPLSRPHTHASCFCLACSTACYCCIFFNILTFRTRFSKQITCHDIANPCRHPPSPWRGQAMSVALCGRIGVRAWLHAQWHFDIFVNGISIKLHTKAPSPAAVTAAAYVDRDTAASLAMDTSLATATAGSLSCTATGCSYTCQVYCYPACGWAACAKRGSKSAASFLPKKGTEKS